MKIEMLEQMFASYLKNVEGCILTQTNWTPSAILLSKTDPQKKLEMTNLCNDVSGVLPALNIFKKNTFEQFVKQCEIDVAGLKINQGKKTAYLFDTAFHENGLGYKDNEQNVLKKIVRAFVIAHLFFDDLDEIEIGFISPKCSPSKEKKIQNDLKSIQPIFRTYNQKIKISTYLDSAVDVLISDLISIKASVADNNDLFMRSVKALSLRQNVLMNSSTIQTAANNVIAKQGNKNTVMNAIDDLIKRKKITPSILGNLLDPSYSKKTFNLSGFPLLIDAANVSQKEQNRYYARVVTIGSAQYRICSQWYSKSLQLFESWYKAII